MSYSILKHTKPVLIIKTNSLKKWQTQFCIVSKKGDEVRKYAFSRKWDSNDCSLSVARDSLPELVESMIEHRISFKEDYDPETGKPELGFVNGSNYEPMSEEDVREVIATLNANLNI